MNTPREQQGIDKRELRRKALEFITELPPVCENSDQARTEWLNTLHMAVQRLAIEFPEGQSARRFFPSPRNNTWAESLQSEIMPNCACSTIHQSKGKEFPAVCVVISPDRAPDNHTSNLFAAWENRTDHEAKRVLYVGVTRAQKLLAIAIPQTFQNRLTAILASANVPYSLLVNQE